jgi:hypothetical protein
MVQEAAVRSEKTSLDMVGDVFKELMESTSPEDQANLLVILNELYADSSCRCEEKEAAYGVGSEEAVACNRNIRRSRDEMVELYKQFLTKVGG